MTDMTDTPLTPEQETARLRETPRQTLRATAPGMEAHLHVPIPVLDHGFVRVVDYMGDDAAVVQAARVSYGAGTRAVSNDEGLIRYLMRHGHSTPFEMAEIKLHVKLPIFVARQWIRHRTANVNEISARYSILDREFYLPDAGALAAQSAVNDQGRGEPLRRRRRRPRPGRPARRGRPHLRHLRGRCWRPRMATRASPASWPAWSCPPTSTRSGTGRPTSTTCSTSCGCAATPTPSPRSAPTPTPSPAWWPTGSRCRWRAFQDYRVGGAHLSAQMLDCVRRMLAGEEVTQETSGMSAREWREFEARVLN